MTVHQTDEQCIRFVYRSHAIPNLSTDIVDESELDENRSR